MDGVDPSSFPPLKAKSVQRGDQDRTGIKQPQVSKCSFSNVLQSPPPCPSQLPTYSWNQEPQTPPPQYQPYSWNKVVAKRTQKVPRPRPQSLPVNGAGKSIPLNLLRQDASIDWDKINPPESENVHQHRTTHNFQLPLNNIFKFPPLPDPANSKNVKSPEVPVSNGPVRPTVSQFLYKESHNQSSYSSIPQMLPHSPHNVPQKPQSSYSSIPQMLPHSPHNVPQKPQSSYSSIPQMLPHPPHNVPQKPQSSYSSVPQMLPHPPHNVPQKPQSSYSSIPQMLPHSPHNVPQKPQHLISSSPKNFNRSSSTMSSFSSPNCKNVNFSPGKKVPFNIRVPQESPPGKKTQQVKSENYDFFPFLDRSEFNSPDVDDYKTCLNLVKILGFNQVLKMFPEIPDNIIKAVNGVIVNCNY